MKNKIIILLIIIFSAISPTFGNVYEHPSDLDGIIKQIPKIGSIKCKFRQEKHLQNISKPLVSSGDFEFTVNKGVHFHTLQPVESTISYTNKNYKQINDVINAISTKKYSKIDREFNFFFEGDFKKWSLGMKPKKQSKSYDYITFITIDGTDYINKISIWQTNGNRTVLWFIK